MQSFKVVRRTLVVSTTVLALALGLGLMSSGIARAAVTLDSGTQIGRMSSIARYLPIVP